MKAKNTKCKMVIASISALISRKKSPCSLVLAMFLFASCSSDPVEVSQSPMKSKVSYLGKDFEGNGPEIALEKDQQAVTEWDFGCQNNFEFDIKEEHKKSNGNYFVSLCIKKVHISLSAPVIIWLPENAAPEVVAHERGHEKICRLVYESSKKTAHKAAESVIGKIFEGEGKDRDEACSAALAQGQDYVCQIYHGEASQDVNAISEIYDALDQNQKERSEDLVNQAFIRYKRISGAEKKRSQPVSN